MSVTELTPSGKGRVVLDGPWAGHRVRVARKAYRCDDRHCPNIIEPGDHYLEGDIDPYRAGGFANERLCLACAKVAL